ncbi:MAG: hypothetical protein ACLSAP_10210 [Oscillospiraceae bacterium]
MTVNKMERASIRNRSHFGGKYGVFDVVEHRGTAYAVKEFGHVC